MWVFLVSSCVWFMGKITRDVRHLVSLGSLTFLWPRVCGICLIDLFPNFALVRGFFLKKGLLRESASRNHLTSSREKVFPSGIVSLLRMGSVSFSDRALICCFSSMISLMCMLFLLRASETSLVMP